MAAPGRPDVASAAVHPGLAAAEQKMRDAGQSEAARDAFARRFERLLAGDSGAIHGDELEPVRELPSLEELPPEPPDPALLDRAVVIKLNGGLGTSMGLHEPKSLVEVKPGVTFLDVIVRQVQALRRRHEARLPLMLMNSFATRGATRKALERYDEPGVEDFLQSMEPKLRPDDL